MRTIIAAFSLIPLLFMAVGVWLVHDQSRKLNTFMPVEAQVVSVTVEARRSSGDGASTTYRPVADYRYQVAGRNYSGTEVTPHQISSSNSGWARRLAEQITPGQPRTAYVNPQNPSESFLLRDVAFLPYLLLFGPNLFVCIIAGVLMSTYLAPGSVKAPQPVTDGWLAVVPGSNASLKRRTWLVLTAIWLGVGLPAALHYLQLTAWSPSVLGLVTMLLHAAGSIACFIAVGYLTLLLRNVEEAELHLDSARIEPGGILHIRVTQRLRKSLVVNGVRVGLICSETFKRRRGSKTSMGLEEHSADWQDVPAGQQVAAGQTYTVEAQFILPPDAPPSTPRGQKGYPRHHWRLVVKADIAASPDYAAEFPILVSPSPVPAPLAGEQLAATGDGQPGERPAGM